MTVGGMARPYYFFKLISEDEFSLLHHQWRDSDANTSHCRIRVISYRGEADVDKIAMMMGHGKL